MLCLKAERNMDNLGGTSAISLIKEILKSVLISFLDLCSHQYLN